MARHTLALLVGTLALAAVPAASASPRVAGPVVKLRADGFGSILATSRRLALYTWRQEKAGTVACTGECARVWPPLVLPRGTAAPKHVAGVRGTFGAIARPDGRRQVTFNGRPLYSYHGDTPTKILCDGVDGWFVVRVR